MIEQENKKRLFVEIESKKSGFIKFINPINCSILSMRELHQHFYYDTHLQPIIKLN